MSVRLDFLNGLKGDLYTYMYEIMDKMYKTYVPTYNDIVEMVPKEKIIDGVFKTTSVIGENILQPRLDGGKYTEDRPQEGYPVIASLKHRSLMIKSPAEFERDWQRRAKSWIKQYATEVWPKTIEPTKEALVAEFLQKGGYTSGDDFYNYDNSDLNLTTYTDPKLQYDGKPIFALSGNNHTAKNASTYYNGLAYSAGDLADITDVNYSLAQAMKNRLIANAFMENGRPFDNTKDLIVICHKSLEDKWKIVNNSTLNPDNGQNASNPIQGTIKKIIGHPNITTSNLSIMQSGGKGIVAYFGAPEIKFWEENNPDALYASINIDYFIALKNFRPLVSVNAAIA